MTRAEEAALTAYPVKVEWVGNQYGGPEDINKLSRKKYQEGYSQAEEDLALGWGDMEKIYEIICEIDAELESLPYGLGYQEYWGEVLRRFNETREKK
jgi:hypothetical protein